MRKERGWSVNYLAMEAMLTQSTLNNLYSRRSEPKLSTLRAICGAFGISLSDFFREEPAAGDAAEEALRRRIRTLSPAQKDALLTILRAMN